MKINITYPILLLLLLFGLNTQAQWDTTWIKTYGGNRDDQAFDVIKTTDNGFLVIGSTSSFGFDNSQMYFLKLDSAGAIMWSKSHGGSGQESGHSVIQTTDGGFLGVGYTSSRGMGGFDLFLVKLDPNGNLEYEDSYGGIDWDFAWDVQEQNPEEYLIAGETQSFGNGGKDGWIVKYSGATQSVLWSKTIGTNKNEYFKALSLDPFGNFIAAGSGFKPNRTDEDVMVTKFNTAGDTIWTKYYGDTLQDYANDVIWMSDSNFAYTGTQFFNHDSSSVYLLKTDSSGSKIWDYHWELRILNEGMKIMEIDSQKLIIVGVEKNIYKETDFFMARTIKNDRFFEVGIIFGGDNDEFGIGAIAHKDGFFSSFGSTSSDRGFYDILLLRVDSNFSLRATTKEEHHEDSQNILTLPKALDNSNSVKLFYEDQNLNITINTKGEYHLSIYSMSGQELYNKSFNEKIIVHSSFLENGLNIICVTKPNSNFWFSKSIFVNN